VASTNLPQQAILQQIQMFRPAFTLADIQNSLSFLDAQQTSIPTVLSEPDSGSLRHDVGFLAFCHDVISGRLHYRS
jgi:hypothetical protein